MLILKPSKIEGVGCFTTKSIKKGTELFNYKKRNNWSKDCIFVQRKNVIKGEKWKYNTWCVESEKGWWCPPDFERMGVVWYLNHSNEPNVGTFNFGYTYFALKNIKIGEELTIDYKLLDEKVDNSI